MERPKWWTGRWLLKLMLLWLALTFVWLPVFSKWPRSITAKSLTILWCLPLLVLALARVAGILGSWANLLMTLYAALPKRGGKNNSRTGNATAR